MAVGPVARRRPGGWSPHGAWKSTSTPARAVAQRVDLRAALGQHDDLEPLAAQRDGAPAGDVLRTQLGSGSVSRMYQFAVRPQSTVRF